MHRQDRVRSEATPQGLAVTRHPGGGWHVVHTWTWRNGGTGLPATGKIRCKRDAQHAMAELHATGCDFTASPADVRQDPAFRAAREVALRWGASDGAIRVPGLSPVCYAARNADGTIHALTPWPRPPTAITCTTKRDSRRGAALQRARP